MPSLMAILGVDISKMTAGFRAASKEAAKTGEEINHALGHGIEHHIGALVSAAALEQVVHKTIEYAEHVTDLSHRLGISTEAVQRWDYALKQSGSSVDDAAPFFEKLAIARKKALAGDEDAIASFKALGVSLEALKNERIEDIGARIADAIKVGDPQKLIADLREVGGKAAGALIPAFREGLTELMDEAPIISDHTLADLKSAGDSMKTIWANIVAGVAPVIGFLAKLTEGFWRGLNVATRAAVGFATGGTAGANDLVKEYEDQLAEADKAREARHHRLSEKLDLGGLEETDSKEKQRKEKAHEDEIYRKRLELYALQRENDLATLSNKDKLIALDKQRAEIVKALLLSQTEEGRLNAAMDIEKIDKERKQTAKAIADEKDKHKDPQRDLNALQKIGAYASVNDTAMVDLTKKSEQHLRDIKDLLNKNNKIGTAGVQF